MMDEAPLHGGRVTQGVVRVGDTVRRPVVQGSELTQRLLVHLQHSGFEGAPRFLGIDEHGRQILTLLPGEPLPGTVILSDRQLCSAADLLRGYHQAASSAPADLRNGCLGYFAWKGLRLNNAGPSVREQRRRLALLAEAYGVPVDDALVTAIDAAYRSMIDKGWRDSWPPASVDAIRSERTWYQQALPSLR
jgi:hypothetical protein